jgi:hypothetical protein
MPVKSNSAKGPWVVPPFLSWLGMTVGAMVFRTTVAVPTLS